MSEKEQEKPRWADRLLPCALAMIVIAAFVIWLLGHPQRFPFSALCAGASAAIFALCCFRESPRWLRFLRNRQSDPLPEELPRLERTPSRGKTYARVLLLFALAILVYFTAVGAARLLGGKNTRWQDTFRIWRSLDSAHYLAIAEGGYLPEESGEVLNLVFFPGFPLLTGILRMLIPDTALCGYLVSILCFLLSGPVLYELFRLDMSHPAAMRTLGYLCFAPAALFFAYPMSESLFLLCTASCLLAARKGKWFPAGILGLCGAFTRSLGVLTALPLAMEGWRQMKEDPERKAHWKSWTKKASALLLIPLGTVLYLYLNFIVTGDPLIFLQYQKSNWHQQLTWFFATAAVHGEYLWTTWADNPTRFVGLWLPNLLAGLAALSLIAAEGKKLRPSYTAWFIAYFLVSYGASWLLSGPRYLAVFFPLAMAVEHLRWPKALKFSLSAALCLTYCVFFALRWGVW